MSSDPTRSVTIRINLEMGNTKLNLPDIGVAKAAIDKFKAAGVDAGKAIGDAHVSAWTKGIYALNQFGKVQRDTWADGMARIKAAADAVREYTAQFGKDRWAAGIAGLEALGQKQRDVFAEGLAQLKAQKAAADELAKAMNNRDRWAAGAAGLNAAGVGRGNTFADGLARLGAQRAAAEAEANAKIADRAGGTGFNMGRGLDPKANNIKMAESFAKAADGALTLARGITLIGVASEKDLTAVVQTISGIQGGIDILRGGVGVVKNLQTGLSLMPATLAAISVGNAAVAATGGTAAAAMTALNVAMGPVGWTILAIGAAVTATSATFYALEKAESEAADTAQKKLVKNMREFHAEILLVKNEIVYFGTSSKASMAQLAASFEEPHKAIKLQTAAIAELQAREKERQRLFANAEGGSASRVAMQAIEAEVDLVRQGAALEKDKLASIKAQHESKLQEFQTQQNILRAAKETLNTEKNRIQTLEQIIGGMTKGEQARFLRDKSRVESGTANLATIKRFQAAGGGLADIAAGDALAARGRAAGGVERFAGASIGRDSFGNDISVADSRQRAAMAQRELTRGGADDFGTDAYREKIDEQIKTMERQARKAFDSQENVILQVVGLLADLESRMKSLQGQLRSMNRPPGSSN